MDGQAFSVSEALRFGWETLKRNLGPSLVISVVGMVAVLLVNGLSQASERYPGLAMAFGLLSQLVQIGVSFVWIRFALALHDGRAVTLRSLVPDAKALLDFVAVSILYGLIVFAGLLLLVVPGVYLAIRYGFATFVVADEHPPVLEALHRSSELTRGVRGRLFTLGLALVAINVMGAVVFGIGLLFTVPLSAFATTLVYRRLLAKARGAHASIPGDVGSAGLPTPGLS
jgi:uncharacterized membrane protein